MTASQFPVQTSSPLLIIWNKGQLLHGYTCIQSDYAGCSTQPSLLSPPLFSSFPYSSQCNVFKIQKGPFKHQEDQPRLSNVTLIQLSPDSLQTRLASALMSNSTVWRALSVHFLVYLCIRQGIWFSGNRSVSVCALKVFIYIYLYFIFGGSGWVLCYWLTLCWAFLSWIVGNVLSRPEQLPGLAAVNQSTGGIWACTIRYSIYYYIPLKFHQRTSFKAPRKQILRHNHTSIWRRTCRLCISLG